MAARFDFKFAFGALVGLLLVWVILAFLKSLDVSFFQEQEFMSVLFSGLSGFVILIRLRQGKI